MGANTIYSSVGHKDSGGEKLYRHKAGKTTGYQANKEVGDYIECKSGSKRL